MINSRYCRGCIHTLKSSLTEFAMRLAGPSPSGKLQEFSLPMHLILFNCIIAVERRISLGNASRDNAGNDLHLHSLYFSLICDMS